MPLRANDHHQANDIEEAERAHLTAVLGQVRAAVARSGALAARTEVNLLIQLQPKKR